MPDPEQPKTGVELQPEDSSAIKKFMSLVRNLPGATEDMNIAVESHLKSHPSYLENAALLSKMESTKPDFYGITALSENLTDGNWDDEDDVPDLMTIFKTECLDKVIAKLEETVTVKEITTRHSTVKSEIAVLREFKDLGATLESERIALQTAVDAFLPEDMNVPVDQRQSKVAEFEAKYKDLFIKYRTAAIPKLVAEGLNKGEYDANTLSSVEKPSEFKSKVEDMRAKKEAEETASTTEEKDAVEEIGDAISGGVDSLEGLLDKLMNSTNGFLATIAALFAVLLNFNPGGIFDGLIDTMSPSETKEVFLDLASGKRKVLMHREEEDAANFKTFIQKRKAVMGWLENAEVGGKKVGKKEHLCYSLFNTEFTIAKFRDLAKNGNDPEALDVEDLPTDYQADFEVVKYVYDQVVAKAPTDGSKDATNLTDFLADPSNGFIEPAPSTPATPATPATPSGQESQEPVA